MFFVLYFGRLHSNTKNTLYLYVFMLQLYVLSRVLSEGIGFQADLE